MQILFINYLYENYWRQFYRERPTLSEASYEEQRKALSEDFFLFYGAYPNALAESGYLASEFFYNVVPLQRAWARENGVQWDEKVYRQRNALEMVRERQPDILFLVSGEHDVAWIKAARDLCPTIRLVVRWCAIAATAKSLRGADLVLTSSRALEQRMQAFGANVRRVPFGFDPRVLNAIGDVGGRSIPMSFVGSIDAKAEFHVERLRFLADLLRQGILEIYAAVNLPSARREYYTNLAKYLYHLAAESGLSDGVIAALPVLGRRLVTDGRVNVKDLRYVASCSRGARFGLEMYRVMARSYATFNAHIDAAGQYVGNIRMFEATGVGACLLTDWKKDLGEFFEIDSEVVAYRSVDEAIDKARWLARNPKVCEEIGAAAQRRVLTCHTYRNRAEVMHGYLREQLHAE